jgi:hypothetical protein
MAKINYSEYVNENVLNNDKIVECSKEKPVKKIKMENSIFENVFVKEACGL